MSVCYLMMEDIFVILAAFSGKAGLIAAPDEVQHKVISRGDDASEIFSRDWRS